MPIYKVEVRTIENCTTKKRVSWFRLKTIAKAFYKDCLLSYSAGDEVLLYSVRLNTALPTQYIATAILQGENNEWIKSIELLKKGIVTEGEV